MTDYTSHFRVPIPDFLSEPWQAALETSIRAMDTAIYEALLSGNASVWANSTVYAVGKIVISPVDGTMWVAAVAHTSTASPTTFTAEKVAHPTYWQAAVVISQQRGTWVTATSYTAGDFVIDTGRYAICLVSHISGTFNTDLAAGKWSVLIDTSGLTPAFNATSEDSIASAATTDLGTKAASRLFVTGTTTITSFGTTANIFKILRFEDVLTLTHNATTLILPGGLNIITAAGDLVIIASNAGGNWRVLSYMRAAYAPFTGKLIGRQVFTASGTYTRSTNCKSVVVEVVGGGGGGGGAAASGAATRAAGAGGGGGGYASKRVTTPGVTETVTVGAGGAGGIAGANNGSTGGTSSFGAHCSATGGSGGTGSSASSVTAADPGAGGTGSGGDLNISGSYGGLGWSQTGVLAICGFGGNAPHSGGGAPSTNSIGTGTAATSLGCGGSGAAVQESSVAAAGGAGKSGYVIVWEYE